MEWTTIEPRAWRSCHASRPLAAQARHAEHGVNVLDAKPCAVLLTTNTFYEHAAWEGTQQTVNVLVHAAAPAAGDDLEICGDRPDFCHDGSYGCRPEEESTHAAPSGGMR